MYNDFSHLYNFPPMDNDGHSTLCIYCIAYNAWTVKFILGCILNNIFFQYASLVRTRRTRLSDLCLRCAGRNHATKTCCRHGSADARILLFLCASCHQLWIRPILHFSDILHSPASAPCPLCHKCFQVHCNRLIQ